MPAWVRTTKDATCFSAWEPIDTLSQTATNSLAMNPPTARKGYIQQLMQSRQTHFARLPRCIKSNRRLQGVPHHERRVHNHLRLLLEVGLERGHSMIQRHATPHGVTISERKDLAVGAVVAEETRHVAGLGEHKDGHIQRVGHRGGVVRECLVEAFARVGVDPGDGRRVLRAEAPLPLIPRHAACSGVLQ